MSWPAALLRLAIEFLPAVMRALREKPQRTHLPIKFVQPYVCAYCGKQIEAKEIGQPC